MTANFRRAPAPTLNAPLEVVDETGVTGNSPPAEGRLGRGLRALGDRARDERGIALVTAIAMLFIITSLTAAVVLTTTVASSQSSRDRNVKRAVAAADGGLDSAVYRVNKMSLSTNECVTVGASTLQKTTVSPGWCPAQTEDLGDGASYSYITSTALTVIANGQRLIQREIVSTGTVNGVKRRLRSFVARANNGLFSDYAIISLNNLTLPNSTKINADPNPPLAPGNIASNGNILLQNIASVCGNATYGAGSSLSLQNSSSLCAGYSGAASSQPLVLNPVDQGTAATVNDNARIGGLDPLNSTSGTKWDANKRVLELQNGATLTLSGNTYSLCSLVIGTSAVLTIAARPAGSPPLRIYIDAPENCSPSIQTRGSVAFQNNGGLINLTGDPSQLQLLVVGSPTIATSVGFANGFSNAIMAIYAPQSTVSLDNPTGVTGAVAAKSVVMTNSASITYDKRAATISGDNTVPLSRRQSWTECTPVKTGSAENSGC